jgi:hypothetical protein
MDYGSPLQDVRPRKERQRFPRRRLHYQHTRPRIAGRYAVSAFGAFGISDYDDPVTIRARKYATGTHILIEEVGVEMGAAPREVVWSKNKARLYR